MSEKGSGEKKGERKEVRCVIGTEGRIEKGEEGSLNKKLKEMGESFKKVKRGGVH